MNEAKKVCAEFWSDPRRRCVGCPIERECSEPLPKPYTMGDVEAREAKIEAAAVALGGGDRCG